MEKESPQNIDYVGTAKRLQKAVSKTDRLISTLGRPNFSPETGKVFPQFNLDMENPDLIDNSIRVGTIIESLAEKAKPAIESKIETVKDEGVKYLNEKASDLELKTLRLMELDEKGYLPHSMAIDVASQQLEELQKNLAKLLNCDTDSENKSLRISIKEVKAGRGTLIIFPNGKTLNFYGGIPLQIMELLAESSRTRDELMETCIPKTIKDRSARLASYLYQLHGRLNGTGYQIEYPENKDDYEGTFKLIEFQEQQINHQDYTLDEIIGKRTGQRVLIIKMLYTGATSYDIAFELFGDDSVRYRNTVTSLIHDVELHDLIPKGKSVKRERKDKRVHYSIE